MESIWTDISLPRFPKLTEDAQTEVLVIGGGIAGILTTYMLKQAGIDCLLAEAKNICNGITKNTTAKITSQHGFVYDKLLRSFGAEKTKLYFEVNEAAIDRYRELCKRIDCDFEEKEAFAYAIHDPRLLERELNALRKIGAPARFASRTTLPFSTLGAVCFPKQAQFHPLKFLAAIAKDLPIYEHTEIKKIEKQVAYTEHGSIRAEKIIVTTHFPFLNRHGFYFLKLYQDRSYVLSVRGGANMHGMYIDGESSNLSFRSAGDSLLIGCGGHRTGKTGSGWQDAMEVIKRYYPDAKIEHRWATQDCMTPDGIPYIGQYSANTPNLYVATGFNKWGMTSAMAAAEILTDLVREKKNRYASLFSPSRSILKPQIAVNAWEAATNLLRPTVPRCPHLGCALQWNKRERTWDCPCHGSRFTENGELIDNPSTKDLRKPPKKP